MFGVKPLVTNSLSILVVDDDKMSYDLVRLYLGCNGTTVAWANRGHLGVGAVKERRYDLVFMDIMMPEMDGYEATLEIRKLAQEQPYIVAFTALESGNAKKFCEDHEFDAYLPKPIRKAGLNEVVSAVRRWKGEREVEGSLEENCVVSSVSSAGEA